MQIQELIQQKKYALKKTKYKFLISELDLILSYIIKQPRAFLYTHSEFKLNSDQLKKFDYFISQRQLGVPLAHLTHHQEFYGFNFWVNQNVLIPRPESEIMVEKIIELSQKYFKNKLITLADIGTGSGCLAISLAKNIKQSKIHAIDISNQALYVARKNARANNVKSKITFHTGNLLEPILNKKIDIIIANLPYVPESYAKKLTKFYNQGLKFEPNLALYSGKDGLDHYRDFFKQLVKMKHLPRFVMIEIDPSQTKEIKQIVNGTLETQTLAFSNLKKPEIKIIQDYNHKDRFVLARLF